MQPSVNVNSFIQDVLSFRVLSTLNEPMKPNKEIGALFARFQYQTAYGKWQTVYHTPAIVHLLGRCKTCATIWQWLPQLNWHMIDCLPSAKPNTFWNLSIICLYDYVYHLPSAICHGPSNIYYLNTLMSAAASSIGSRHICSIVCGGAQQKVSLLYYSDHQTSIVENERNDQLAKGNDNRGFLTRDERHRA